VLTAPENASGARFVHWRTGLGSLYPDRTMSEPMAFHSDLTAVYGYALALTVVEPTHGEVQLSPGPLANGPPPTYLPSTALTLTADPKPLRKFSRWEGDVPDGSTSQNPLTIIMDSDKTVTAVFECSSAPALPLVVIFAAICGTFVWRRFPYHAKRTRP
jgi:hypothetical protein